MLGAIKTSTSVHNSPRSTAICCSLAAVGGALIAAHLLMTLFEGRPAAANYALASATATQVTIASEAATVTLVPRIDPVFEPPLEMQSTPAAPAVIEPDPPLATLSTGAVPLPRPRPVQHTRPRSNVASAETGLGSYYKPSTIACGGRIDPQALTAAHKSLPCGTLVKVTNAKNGRYAMVQINDRGPFIRGRVIDVNQAAARDLDMIGSGVVPVRVEVMH
jgi:rare lipoprotein A (peptidoglycan hydrolase)